MPIFSHTVTGYLFALLATVVWSGNFVVARGLAGALSPVELSFWRWSIAFLTILPFAGRSLLRSLPLVRGTWGKVILMALLGITCFNTFIYQAGHTTDATNMSLLATASPIVMAAIAHLFLRERLSRFQFFGLCGALCGVIILVSRGRLGTLLGLRFAQGDLWMLLSVFLFAVYSLMLRCRPKAFPQKAFLALLIGIGVLGLIPPLLWQAADTGLSPLDGSILSALIYIGVGASVVSFLAWSLAIERIGMVRAGIIYNSIPLFASLEATLFLGESITLPQMIGGVLIIGGICLDDNAKTVTVDGDPVALTPKEYDILRFLMQNAGTVFSPSEIYRRVWDDVPLNATGAIAVHIRHLREKLEINPSEPRYIKVVWGKGYKMEGTLT